MNENHSAYPQTRDELIGLLKQHDINPTSQRIEIAGFVLNKPQHVSADQILAYVKSSKTYVSKSTVYNTLNLFARKGLVKELIIDNDKVFFDSNTSEHHHFFNEETSELMDFNTDQIRFTELPEPPQGLVATGVDIVVKVKKQD